MRWRIFLASAGTLLAACGSAGENAGGSSQGANVSVAEVALAPQVQTDLLVSGEWLSQHLEDPGVVVLHVAPNRDGYDQGHIPGARFLPQSAIVVERDGNINELPPVAHLDSVFESVGVSDDTRVVVYGAPLWAARTFFTLDYLGHGDRTALLNGGLEDWKVAGRPLTTEAPRVARGTFTPRPQPELVVDAAWVEQHLHDPGVALIDARPEAEFTGAEAGDGVPRPGHIPGAGNLFWGKLIHSTDHPQLLNPDTLRALFREAGAVPGDTVVTYCRTGVQASFAYFVSRYLGYQTRMYDGSFMDWSQREELPVER